MKVRVRYKRMECDGLDELNARLIRVEDKLDKLNEVLHLFEDEEE